MFSEVLDLIITSPHRIIEGYSTGKLYIISFSILILNIIILHLISKFFHPQKHKITSTIFIVVFSIIFFILISYFINLEVGFISYSLIIILLSKCFYKPKKTIYAFGIAIVHLTVHISIGIALVNSGLIKFTPETKTIINSLNTKLNNAVKEKKINNALENYK